MISTIQVLVLLLGVVAAVAVISARLRIPNAILLVLTGVGLALVLGLPTVELARNWFSPFGVATRHLHVGGGDELARGPAQPWSDFAACGGLRGVHDGSDRRGSPLAIGARVADWFRP